MHPVLCRVVPFRGPLIKFKLYTDKLLFYHNARTCKQQERKASFSDLTVIRLSGLLIVPGSQQHFISNRQTTDE